MMHLDVGVRDVAGQVLAASGVVQPDDARTDQARAADRDHVVGRVVEKHPDVRRPVRAQPRTQHRGEPDARLVELAVGDDKVPELENGAAPIVGVLGVALEQVPRIGCGKRRLTGRRRRSHPPLDLGRKRAGRPATSAFYDHGVRLATLRR